MVSGALRSLRGRFSQVKGAYGVASDGAARHPGPASLGGPSGQGCGWLATQERLTEGRTGGDDPSWRLHRGDLVVVDESAMADTAALAAVHARVADAGGKLLLVGDHRQLAAIGAGGAMDLLADAGASYELTEARPFREPWERDASLRLRTGHQTVLQTYHRHGRFLAGGATDPAEAPAARA